MGYMQDIEGEFRRIYDEKLRHMEHEQELVGFLKAKVLESYKNGLRDGKKPRKQPEPKK